MTKQQDKSSDAAKAEKAAARAAAKAEAARTDARGTVSIACRLPTGLAVDVAGYGEIYLRGANDASALVTVEALDPQGQPLRQNGHGITSGVPSEVWEAIQKQYKTAKWLTNGAVYAATKRDAVVDEALEREGVDVGFNGVDPSDPGPNLQPGGAPPPMA